MEKRSSWKDFAGRLNTQVPSENEKPGHQSSLLFSRRIPVLCKASTLPCWSQPCHALPHRPWLRQHHHQLLQSFWCRRVLGQFSREKSKTETSHQKVGLLMGVSSLLGFLGSVAFPLLRAKLGTSFTALIGSLASSTSCLCDSNISPTTQECPSWLCVTPSVQSLSFSPPPSS